MIDKLEFLIALAKERHFGRAAEACGVTQPTLSAGPKQLEETLGLPLVERSSRFRGFTPEGERVLDWARRIVGDARAMRKDVDALKRGLAGDFRIAAIPTALPVVSTLTTPFRMKHPNVRFVIFSQSSIQILEHLENLEIDAGITYLDNEPLGRVNAIPIYEERYFLLTADSAFAGKTAISWADAASAPLCLLTPDMQNRRIIDAELRKAGVAPDSTLQSNSMIVLFSHVRTGHWSSIMSAKLAELFALTGTVRALPIIEPDVRHIIGLVLPEREPMPPLTAAFARQARQLSEIVSNTLQEVIAE